MTTEVIWADFGSKLLSFIKARVNNPENAEDILQEVFIKIHEKSNQLKDERKLTSWIYQITRNAIIDYHRKKKIPVTSEFTELSSDTPEADLTPQFVKCMIPFVKELPDKYRYALEKTVYGDLSQKEYAEELNITYSAVKSRVQRARQMLKELFTECCSIKTDRYGNIISSAIDDCSC
jgi:RNA polymerase sigma-70 factor (ECF subfamily)